MRRVPLAVLSVLLTTAALAAACTTAGPSTGAATGDAASDPLPEAGPPVDGGKLVFAVYAESEGWNQHDSRWAQYSSVVGSTMLEPLAALDADLNPVAWLAASWSSNPTFDEYTIQLREDVLFHDGEPFDAEAVKANIDDLLVGAQRRLIWEPVLAGTTVIDDHTLRVDLKVPFATFPVTYMASQTAMMMAPSALGAPDRGNDEPVGTGPFVFRDWVKDNSLTVVKNERYWQAGLPHLDEIEFRVVNDASSAASGLVAGDLDVAFTNAMAAVGQVPDDFTIVKDWTSEPGMAITNTSAEIDGEPNPLANEHARRALALATDQQALADLIGPGVELPSSPFSADSKWGLAPEDSGYPGFDLDEAREEVRAFEEQTGQSLAVTLSSGKGTDTELVVQALQSQWSEAGIDTQIESLEATAFIADVVTGNYQVALFNVYSSPDPDQNRHFWTSENVRGPGEISINFTRYTTPRIDQNLKIGRESDDFATRKRAYDEIVQEINAAAVNIWTYSIPYSIIARPGVHGLEKAADVPFGNYQPKTWLGDLWIDE